MKKSLICLLFLCHAWLGMAQLKLAQLKVENAISPIGIGTNAPRFSWQLTSDKRNVKQTAYEIQVKAGKETV